MFFFFLFGSGVIFFNARSRHESSYKRFTVDFGSNKDVGSSHGCDVRGTFKELNQR